MAQIPRKNGVVELTQKVYEANVYRWEAALIILKIVSGNIRVLSRCGESELGPNDFIVFNPSEFHFFEVEESCTVIELKIEKSFLREIPSWKECMFILCNSSNYSNRFPAKYNMFCKFLDDIIQTISNDEMVSPKHLWEQNLEVLLIYLFEQFDFISSGFAGKRFTHMIVERYRHLFGSALINGGAFYNLSLKEISESIGLSYAHLRKDCAGRYGHGFTWFKNRMMVEEASKKILTSKSSITAIASEVGFSDTKYMVKNFRSVYGCTPSEFRNRYLNTRVI